MTITSNSSPLIAGAGTVSAGFFVGDGSGLTGISGTLSSGTTAGDALTWSGSEWSDHGALAITGGGTGATTAMEAINNLLPSQSGNNGNALVTDGANVSWEPIGGTGTVTSVDVSGGNTGLTTSGGPVTGSGTITISGMLKVAYGGTGANTASGALTNLGAAASGANSDITSLSALTTAISIAQGGTGSSTASGARTNLGAAASGANSDITSLTALTTPLSASQGGTGTASAAAHTVLAGPTSGSSAAPSFRALVSSDLPTGSGSYIQNGTSVQSSANFNISGNGAIGGSLLVSGSSAKVPASGAGTRMMFVPTRGAFRVGAVDGTQWDSTAFNNNIGLYSIAEGWDTKASAQSSTALGASSLATAQYATAIGTGNSASGFSSMALGTSNTASGSYSFAMGNLATSDSNGSFVYSDGSANTISDTSNEFMARASHGYKLFDDATATPGLTLSGGVLSANSGFQVGDTASTSGTFLRGNGTKFVPSTIQASDLPSLASSYIQNTNTTQANANFNISGNGTAGQSLTTNLSVALDTAVVGSPSQTGTFILYDGQPHNAAAITVASLAANRNYTIPDAGADAGFVMDHGTQTVAGAQAILFSAVNTSASYQIGGTTVLAYGGQSFFAGPQVGSNATGVWNTGLGIQALQSLTSGHGNTAAGLGALSADTSGNSNTAYGYQSLIANTTANSNDGFGEQTLFHTTTGSNNAAVKW